MAFNAFIDSECILAFAVACTAGLAVFHVSHGCFGRADPVGEDLGVTIDTFVRLQVELMAESGLASRFRHHVGKNTWFQAPVAFSAVAGCGEHILAVVAGAARFAGGHIFHGEFADHCFIGEDFGVTLVARIGSGVNSVAESRRGEVVDFENNILGGYALVTFGAVTGCGEHVLAVVAGAARFTGGHSIHGEFAHNRFIREDLGVTLFACIGSGVNSVAECRRGEAVELENNILGYHALVTLVTVAGRCEHILAVVAGAA